MKLTVVIMAGGKGERFWPKSRVNRPKQFISLTQDGKTMIQHTVDRIKPLVAMKDIFIVTNKAYKDLVLEQLEGIPEENILLEPMAKDTAPCIGLAAVHIKKIFEEAIMIVLPADHLIKYNELFIDTLKEAIALAEKDDNMATIGIIPSYPETSYGYIHFGAKKEGLGLNAYEVERFVEKPEIETAKDYVASGKYLWNSGIFIWKVSTILRNFEVLLSNTYSGLMRIYKTLNTGESQRILEEEFSRFEAQSLDYGIMEKASNIYTFPGNFGWDDVGSWLALERINKTNELGNIVTGNVVTIGCKNSIIQAGTKLVAAVGVEGLVIVDTEDALLICEKIRRNI